MSGICKYSLRKRNKNLLSFICGMVIGITLTYLNPENVINFLNSYNSTNFIRITNRDYQVSTHNSSGIDEYHSYENNSIAEELFKTVKVLCMITTTPDNHKSKAEHVKKTWGKRCNVLLFMSTIEDPSLPAIALPVQEGRENLWNKTKVSARYVREHYFDKVDWFLKADDDTYVIMENLRYLLAGYDKNKPLYIGCRFKPFSASGFMSGGAGYVLSKSSLDMFVKSVDTAHPTGPPQSDKPEDKILGTCNTNSPPKAADGEDVRLGMCMDKLGVISTDTRDLQGRWRFFPYQPKWHIFETPQTQGKDFWLWNYTYYEIKTGMDCCSDYAVSFHYISPQDLYVLEYLIYHLRPFGNARNDHLLLDKIKGT